MSDYKETVNSLREHADLIETSIEVYGPSATRLLVYDLRNAAAAIEDLQGFLGEAERDRDEYRERLDKTAELVAEMQKDLDDTNAANVELYWAMRDTVCRCNVKENAELIAKILDDDVDGKVYHDSAIEELQADNAAIQGELDALRVFTDEAQNRIEELQAEVQELKRVNLEIFEDLPKLGEWLTTQYYTWECSVCGKNPTTGMGYVQARKALYKYCPNCGAKMEVQDG